MGAAYKMSTSYKIGFFFFKWVLLQNGSFNTKGVPNCIRHMSAY